MKFIIPFGETTQINISVRSIRLIPMYSTLRIRHFIEYTSYMYIIYIIYRCLPFARGYHTYTNNYCWSAIFDVCGWLQYSICLLFSMYDPPSTAQQTFPSRIIYTYYIYRVVITRNNDYAQARIEKFADVRQKFVDIFFSRFTTNAWLYSSDYY